MNFTIGDIIGIQGERLKVVGKIAYQNKVDGCHWDEYRLISEANRMEKWLSVDDLYREYSICVEAERNFDHSAYHQVDHGVEMVVARAGAVDVDPGETAAFAEYEDATEEYIYSEEKWSDGTERSKGYYLDPEEIVLLHHDQKVEKQYKAGKESSSQFLGILVVVIAVFVCILSELMEDGGFQIHKKISKYLKNSSMYSYETSITGSNSQKADVYSSFYDLDTTAKDIIDNIDGDTDSVQQNTEDGDNSIAILTDKEYCLIYVAEDDKTLVQISTRKYAYSSDEEPYHCRTSTGRYYRRFYRWRGYSYDIGRYGKYASPYGSYGDSSLDENYSDTYRNYSSSVRQASVYARESSGGGTSYGK